jgi:hypothetical protein
LNVRIEDSKNKPEFYPIHLSPSNIHHRNSSSGRGRVRGKKLILDRIVQIDDEIVEADPEYKRLGERPDELLKLVAAKLSPEDNQLLKEYDNIWFDQIIRRDELIYNEALMDGISIGYWVTMVGREVAKIKV